MHSGDTLVVWKLDRLTRTLMQLIETVEALEAQGIGFVSITEAINTPPRLYDPEFAAHFPAPNHPSYPAAHSVLTNAVVHTMAALFTQDAEELTTLGNYGQRIADLGRYSLPH